MKKYNSSLFLMACVISMAAQAGGIGRMDPKGGESRPDPRQSMERALTLNSGVRKTHEMMLHNIRLKTVGLESAQIENLRVAAQRQTPEVVYSLGRLYRDVVGTESQSPNLTNVRAVAVEVLKARMEMPWFSELRSNIIDESGSRAPTLDPAKVAALPKVKPETIILRIEMIRRAVGLPGGAGAELARFMNEKDLEEYAQRAETDLQDRQSLLRESDPVAAQFIEDVLSICPYFAEYVE